MEDAAQLHGTNKNSYDATRSFAGPQQIDVSRSTPPNRRQISSGWWYTYPTPLKNDGVSEFVSWDDDMTWMTFHMKFQHEPY
jgi:hypothetical protein